MSNPAAANDIGHILTAAVEHIQAGRLEDAVATLAANGGPALRNPVGRNIRGDIRLKQGRPQDALKDFDAAIRMAPNFPEAHSNRGVALQELGRLADALAAEERAVRLRPGYATAHFNRGNVLRALDRNEDAISAFDAALKAQTAFPEALVNRGETQLKLQRSVAALDDFRRAIAIRPNYVEAHVAAAGAHQALNQTSDALATIDKALAIDPDHRGALVIQSDILREARRADEALAVADRLVTLFPSDHVGYTARAQALQKLRRFDEALAAADEAIRAAPESSEPYVIKGTILVDFGRFDAVDEALATAERLGVAGPQLFHTRGVALAEAGRFDEAIAAYDRSLETTDNALYRYHRSFLRLAQGDYVRGWAEYEARLTTSTFARPDFLKLAPMWKGEDLTGKRILLYSEQGHGDTIQFVRYAPEVARRGGSVSLVVHEPLRRLFADNFPGFDVADSLGMRTGFDFQAPIMSLPFIFGMTDEAQIPPAPFLKADPERVARWRERIGAEGFKVGVNWQGSKAYGGDHARSISLARFAPLAAVPGVRLISLQAQQGMEQLDNLPAGMTVETLGERLTSNPDGFREMAAVMEALDLMIMSDSGPAHLAGALGRPAWIALRDVPDWGWQLKRTDTPWYPTLRLFRQQTRGVWEPLFDEIAGALADVVAGRG